MKIEGGRIINDFIEPNKRQYAIPVYQRNYEWPTEQCIKLFDDIINAYRGDKTHFCGSIVYAPLKEEHNIHYYVIVDGQQRLTTIYLMLKALVDSSSTDKERESLLESMVNHDKFDEFEIDIASKLKLKPIKTDNDQLSLLMEDKFDQMDVSSGIWLNYETFKNEINKLLESDDDLDVKKIYKGIEKLTCAMIKLDEDDNAQEIFERINSTGVPLSLADKIRNFVLMTDANQDELYEKYWINIEGLVEKKQMSDFFTSYLNLYKDGFVKDNEAYDDFKNLYKNRKWDNEETLKDVLHYAHYYYAFNNDVDDYGENVKEYLNGIRQLKQTTCYLFLYKVFDDYNDKVIDRKELEKILQLVLSYSVRRIMCEVSSNSLRGFYKTLYNRVFSNSKNKEHYYDSIVSFMQQTNTKDAIPTDEEFATALKRNNLYRKHALCKYLLISIENQGKEKLYTDSLSIEHVMPQNDNLSPVWRRMLGDNWESDRNQWLHTLGNLTLTGYNSELGDKPFDVKKKLIEEKKTKVVNLYEDIREAEIWDADAIKKRADRLIKQVKLLYPILKSQTEVSFKDPNYAEYTCEDPENAKFKSVNYYVILGERVNVDSFAGMVRSVCQKLYDLDSSIIERMAKNEEKILGWTRPLFSYNKIRKNFKIDDTDIYILTGLSATDNISFIKAMIEKYDLSVAEDFVYSAKVNSNQKVENDISLIPNGIYYIDIDDKYAGKGKAELKVEDGSLTVLKGSTCCPTSEPWLPQARKNAIIKNNVLMEDVECDSPSTAAWIPLGHRNNGWLSWKTQDGDAIDVFRSSEVSGS